MDITTDALVIREMSIGENDRLITLMTHDLGVIKAYAHGVKNFKSKRAGATSLLSYSSFTLSKKGDTYRIKEASVKNIFFTAGYDVSVFALSQYFCELCYVLGPDDSNSSEFLRLILNSLHFLTAKGRSVPLIKAITELRIAAISGYMPNLVACGECGEFESDIMYFSLENGEIYCEDCSKNGIKINKTVLSAMRHIVYSPFKDLYSFEIPEEAAVYLSDITEKYISYQSEYTYSTLEFFKTLG